MAIAQPTVRQISRCTVKPRRNSEAPPPQPWYLTPWDLAMLSAHSIQKGLLFSKPFSSPSDLSIIDHLKHSLSSALYHFFPLAGCLVTKKDDDPLSSFPPYLVFVDCNNSGAEFIHSYADHLTVADIINPLDVPDVIKSFFPYDFAVNHDGHTIPLLSVQVTELVDGIFVGCSFNHVMGDGTSFWHFFNMWAEISRTRGMEKTISHPPVLDRWFLEGKPRIVGLPFSHHDEFVVRYTPPPLRERIFHFSTQSMARIKAKANSEHNTDKISSFQALSAHMWRSITRARKFPADRMTRCRMAINNRSRLSPPLSPDYFGNCMQPLNAAATTVGELLSHDLGWAAWLLHQSVVGHGDEMARGMLEAWYKDPFIYPLSRFDPDSVMMGSSPRFDMYGNDFGWGKAVAVRSGHANKFDGKISSYPGVEGGASVDLEVCLPHETMSALESDEHFMDVFSI